VWCGLRRDTSSDCGSGVGENEVLHVCGVDAEMTWAFCEAVSTTWACGQRRVVSLDAERLNMSTQPTAMRHRCECAAASGVLPCRLCCGRGDGASYRDR
jgi:hypothetical protein